jgi:hypothetical protein
MSILELESVPARFNDEYIGDKIEATHVVHSIIQFITLELRAPGSG